MSTPTLDTQYQRPPRAWQSDSERRAERLRGGAAAIRRTPPHPRAHVEQRDMLREPAATPEVRATRERRGEQAAAAREERRDAVPRDRSEERPGPARRTRDLESVRERAERARAAETLAKVNTSGWWDNATAGDLERARKVAAAPSAGAGTRSAIQRQMADVSQRRYGTSVDGAIRYERDNPYQPPPDMRGAAAPLMSGGGSGRPGTALRDRPPHRHHQQR